MTQRAPGRKSALIALTAVALLALGVMAPVASAQVPGVVDNAVGGATGAVDQVSSGAVGGGTDAVAGTVDTVTGTNDGGGSGGSTVGNVVQDVGGVVNNTVDKTTDAGNTIYEGTKKTVENTTSETGTTVNGIVNGVGDMGGGLTNPLLNVKDPRNRDRDGDGNISKGERNLGGSRADNRKAAMRGEIAADRAARKASEHGKNAALANAERKNRNTISSTPAFAVAPPREGLLAQAAQLAGEAAEKLAFPLGLALMVGAFLMVQGRIDRKDAKLVLAPIDSEQDLLSFQ